MTNEHYSLRKVLDNPDATCVDGKFVSLHVYYDNGKVKAECGYKRKRDDGMLQNVSSYVFSDIVLVPESIVGLGDLLDNVPTSLHTTVLLMVTQVLSVAYFLKAKQ